MLTTKSIQPLLFILKAAIIAIVVAWVLNIPGRMQIGLFTEQILVSVLGLSLALTFLMFPLTLGESGEEAVFEQTQSGKDAVDLAFPISSSPPLRSSPASTSPSAIRS